MAISTTYIYTYSNTDPAGTFQTGTIGEFDLAYYPIELDSPDCPLNLPITVNWEVEFGADPVTTTLIQIYKNGDQIYEFGYDGSGTLPALTFYEGDTIRVYQAAYPTFRWAPTSNANLTMKRNTVDVYNDDVTDQTPVALQDTGDYVIPDGTTVIDIISTGSSTAIGYSDFTLQTTDIFTTGDIVVDLTDTAEAGLGLVDLVAAAGTNYYPFNLKDGAGTVTVDIVNTTAYDLDITVNGVAFTDSFTLSALDTVSVTSVPKGNIEIINTTDIEFG